MKTQPNYIEQTLQFIAKKGYQNNPKKFIIKSVKFLADLLQVDYVLVGKYSIDTPNIVKTISVYGKGKYIANIEYELEGTPCENVINKKLCVYPNNIQTLFPKDEMLVNKGVDSYVGAPLWASNREPIGLIAILDKNPIANSKIIETAIQMVAIKLEEVLEKIQYKKKIKLKMNALKKAKIKAEENKEKFKKLSNLSFESILIHKKGVAIDVNIALTEMFGYKTNELIGKNIIKLLFPKEHHETIIKNIHKNYIFPYEIEGKKKDGTLFPVEIEARIINQKSNNDIEVAAIRDLSFRKQSQLKINEAYKTIKEKEHYLSTILHTVEEGFWVIDNQGITVDVNPKMCKILEHSQNEILGKSIFDFVDEENTKIFKEQLKKRELGVSSTYEINLLKKDKKNVPCLFKTSPLFNNEKNRIGSFAMVTDISLLKNTYTELEKNYQKQKQLGFELAQKNKMLKESQINYRNLFEESPVSILEQDFSEALKLISKKNLHHKTLNSYFDSNIDFLKQCISKIKIIDVNNAALQLLKVKNKNEFVEQIRKTNNQSAFNSIKTELLTFYAGNREFNGETEFVSTDGTLIKALVKTSAIGNTGKVIASIIDITEIKNTKQELIRTKKKIEKSEKKFRELYEKSGDAILIIKNGVFIDCNLATVKMLNYNSKESFLNTHPSELSPAMQSDGESSMKKADKMIDLALKNGTQRFEWLHVKNDGEVFPVEVLLTAISKEANNNVIHCVWRDISNRKKAELEIIKAKEKAEESNHLKTEFLQNMSHEIRTPMNGILGFSDLLSSPGLSDKKRANFVQIIKNSGKQLLSIIDDILEISHLETKQITKKEEKVILNDVLLGLFSVFDRKAYQNKTPLYLKNNHSDSESTILIDKSKLIKILSNLLDNAIKYTNEGNIEFGYNIIDKENSKVVELYVRDTGIGIHSSKHKIIFERFSQGENEISKKTGGLGLGLSIAKENTELLGGKISLISKKWKGATFIVEIPYKPYLNVVKNNFEINKEKQIIIIAEDEEVNYLFLETLLKEVIKIKCTVLHAKNGKETVEMFKENKQTKLILMDIKMPVMNGYEATKKIKEIQPNIPIIAQTAYSTKEDKKKAFDAGCDDFISKPISIEALKTTMEKFEKIYI